MSISVVPPPPSADRPRFTKHSRKRLAELRIPEQMVREAIRSPLVTQPGGPEHANNAVVYVGRDVRAVFDPGTATVITVHLCTRIPYVHGVHTLNNLPQDPCSSN